MSAHVTGPKGHLELQFTSLLPVSHRVYGMGHLAATCEQVWFITVTNCYYRCSWVEGVQFEANLGRKRNEYWFSDIQMDFNTLN